MSAVAKRKLRLSPAPLLSEYKPLPSQKIAHQRSEKYRALVGGVGSGKSVFGCREVLKWSQLYPGGLHVIGRLEAKSLRNTTQRRFFEICPKDLIEDWNQTDAHLWLKTPESGVYTEILFMHLDDPGPLGSLDISGFWIDEAHEADGSEVPETTFEMLQARLRHPAGPHKGIVSTNSGGKDWVYRWFFAPGHDRDFWGIQVDSRENRYLPPTYVDELERTHPKDWVERFLRASFDTFEGQVFTEYDPKVEYDDSTMEPFHTQVEAGFDFGVTAPTAVVYGFVDYSQTPFHVWLTDEFEMADANPSVVSDSIKAHGLRYTWADPACQYRTGPDRTSAADLYGRHGISLLPSPNDDLIWASLMHRLLREGRLHINRKRCPRVIAEIKACAWDPGYVSGKSTIEKFKKTNTDHPRDALKYFMLSLCMAEEQDYVGEKVSAKPKRHPSYDEDEDNDPHNLASLYSNYL